MDASTALVSVTLPTTLRPRLARAHAIARYACEHLPLPLFWLAHHVVCRLMLPRLVGPVRVPTIYGFDLVVRRTTGDNYYRCGFYEHGTMHVIERSLRPGDVFVDAGASVGQMTFHAARCVGPTGRVLAFEPAPVRCADLETGLAVNGLANVAVYPIGLADAAAEKQLDLACGSPSMFAPGRDAVAVPVRPLDDVLAEAGVARVRMLKIDVEGLEPEVLLGARRLLASPEPPIVCYEHGIYTPARDVAEILRSASGDRYGLYQLARTMHRPSRLVRVERTRLRADNVFAIPHALVASLPPDLVAG